MTAARRQAVPPPDMSGLSSANPLLSRFGADVPGPAPAAPATAVPKSRSAGSEMDRRSWYMPKASADALAAAVEDLHFATRQPKHAVLAAIVEVALAHREDVLMRLVPGWRHQPSAEASQRLTGLLNDPRPSGEPQNHPQAL